MSSICSSIDGLATMTNSIDDDQHLTGTLLSLSSMCSEGFPKQSQKVAMFP
jgi:hypothetical protein